jgi:ABC-type branched-subunit amino acid transport system substrate-binding protein
MSAKALLREFSQHGQLPDSKFEIDPRRASHDEQVEALRACRPGLVLIVAGAELSAKLTHEVAAVCPNARLYGTHTLGRRLPGDAGGGGAPSVVFPMLLAPADSGRWTRFRSAFKAHYNSEPDYAVAAAYDATRLVTEKIRKFGASRARLRQALAESGTWEGVSGIIRFDGTGQNARCDLQLSATDRSSAIR